jgi:hypothetical protein
MSEIFGMPSPKKKARKPRTTKLCPRCGKGHYKLSICSDSASSEQTSASLPPGIAYSSSVSEYGSSDTESTSPTVGLSATLPLDNTAFVAIMQSNREYLQGFGYSSPSHATGLLLPQDDLEGDFQASRSKRQEAWLMHPELRVANLKGDAESSGRPGNRNAGKRANQVEGSFHYPEILSAEAFNEATDVLRSCMVCSVKSYVRCNQCDVFLCAAGVTHGNCFWRFHTCDSFTYEADDY